MRFPTRERSARAATLVRAGVLAVVAVALALCAAVVGPVLASSPSDQGGGPAPVQLPSPLPPPASEPPVPGSALVGPTWHLVEVWTGSGGLGPALPTPDVTLHLGADGTVTGNAGCNSFGGGYELDGDRLAFERVVSTLRACVDRPVMTQERAYLDALQATAAYTLAGDTLTLLDGSGTPRAVLRTR